MSNHILNKHYICNIMLTIIKICPINVLYNCHFSIQQTIMPLKQKQTATQHILYIYLFTADGTYTV